MWSIASGWRSSKHFIVATICIAMFTDGFAFGVVVPVYPFLLQKENIVSASRVQLYTSILTAAFPISDLITAPICAFYVDHYHSRRVPWFIGLAGIVAGNVLFGVGNNFALLLASRLLQGAASAILYTVGLAVLVESVSKNEVGTFMGSAMSCNNFGIIMSPLLGGALYETRGKMAVFGLMIAVIGVDITMRVVMKERPAANSTNVAVDVDLASDVGDLGASEQDTAVYNVHVAEECLQQDVNEKKILAITIHAVDQASVSSASSGQKQSVDTSAKQSSKSARNQSRQVSSKSRLKGVLKLVKSPRLLAALYGCFINECIVASLCAVLPLFVERTLDWTSLQAGCLFLAIAIPGLAGSLAGMLADKVGARWVSVAGFLLTTPSLIAMMAVKSSSTSQAALLCVLLSMAGSTIIFFLAPLGADLSHVADAMSVELGMDLYASSFSLMNTSLATAGVVGPLFMGWLQEELGWTGTCAAMGILCVSGAIPCVSILWSWSSL